MGLLPWTFSFLFLLSLLLWTQLKTITEMSLLHKIALNSLDASGERLGIIVEQHARPQKTGKGKSHTHAKREFSGQRTSKLHLNDFFGKSNRYKETQKKLLFKLVAVLYGNQPIFSPGDNTAAVLSLFEKVCKKGDEIHEIVPFNKVEDLALISLRENPSIPNFEHSAYYHMLRGGNGELLYGSRCKLEGLQYYVSLHKHGETILSIYLAPKNLLLALFGPEKEDVVNELLLYRQEIWKEFRKEKGKNRDTLKNDLSQKFLRHLPSDIEQGAIDFEVSSSRPQDYPKSARKSKKTR